MIDKISYIFISLIFLGLISTSQASAAQSLYHAALPQWASTLETYVDTEGRVDFYALKQQPSDLKKFVDAIEKISPISHPELFKTRDEVLAYHVNTYNALAMWGVLERDIPKNFNTLIKRASFFKLRNVVIGGKKTNLYDYENKVIRPLDEARTHFALNCMVRGCPRLPQKIFQPETLDQSLQAASIEFFNQKKHIQIDHEAKQVKLSGIMKFYTKDFTPTGKKQDLISYVNQFVEQKIPEDYKVKYIKYDWTINQQPKG